jgi:hypothetical protein
MAMMFTLATYAREWLRDKAHFVAPCDMEDQAARRAAAEAAEEARRLAARAAGTPVTAETYAAWWSRYRAEQKLAQATIEAADPAAPKRLTGFRYFETRGDKAGDEDEEPEDEEEEEESEAGAVFRGAQEDSESDDDSDFDPSRELGSDDEEEFLEQYQRSRG